MCLGVGIASHVLLDLVPHYAWIVYLPGYEHVPFHWLIREGMVAAIVALPALFFARRFWPYALAGMVGSVYPDIEKVASVDFNLPETFILFRWHSTQLSCHDGGLPHWALITAELLLNVGLLLLIWRNSVPGNSQDLAPRGDAD